MSAYTGIQWTDRTWNPIRGCSRVSVGCQNCYAEAIAARFSGPGLAYEGLARRRSNGEPQWTGEVRLIEPHVADPLRVRAPQRWFVNSMSDLFHERVPFGTIDLLFGVMAAAPQHTFQILTKRPARMLEWARRVEQNPYLWPPSVQFHAAANDWFCGTSTTVDRARGSHAWDRARHVEHPWPLPNVQLGVSVEHQPAADERIRLLLETPAAVRFLSCEPLLGEISFSRLHQHCPEHDHPGGFCTSWHEGVRFVDWIIVGGESGPKARPCNSAWIADIVAQCRAAQVPCFVKQLGRWVGGDHAPFPRPVARWLLSDGSVWTPGVVGAHNYERPDGAVAFGLWDAHGGDPAEWPAELRVREFPIAQEVRS